MKSVEDLIPQRAPFKFLDEILDFKDSKIITKVTMHESFSFYEGHFPGNAVTPGVILCEAAFQAGAALMSLRGGDTGKTNTAVVTRIQSAKFKSISRPGDEVIIEVELKEQLANAAYMKGKLKADGKTLLIIEFAAATVDAN